MKKHFINVRSSIALWDTLSFNEWVHKTFWSDNNIRKKLRKQLQALNLSDKKINGSSVVGLERSQEGAGGGGISYTETFFKVVNETKGCNPIDYLYLIVEEATQRGYYKEKTRGIIARGMRTYASLLRDHDFAFKIDQKIKRRRLSRSFKVSSGSVEDAKNHTDVLVSSDTNDYRIWLFQSSKMGLPHNIERLTGLRGKLPKGIHILCPLKSEYQRNLETVSARIIRLCKKIEAVKEKEKITKRKTKALSLLRDRLQVYARNLTSLKANETGLKNLLNGNIDPYHGWYLYGDKAVTETLNTIVGIDKGSIKPRSYIEVYNMLNAPKKYLSDLASFKI